MCTNNSYFIAEYYTVGHNLLICFLLLVIEILFWFFTIINKAVVDIYK